MSTPSRYLIAGFFLFAVGGHVRAAATINFSATPVSTNLESDGACLMSGSFVFAVGAFTGGFQPTPGNVAQWKANFQPLAFTAYNPVTRFFAGTATLSSNAAPFTTTNRGYIWGFRSGGGSNEWILIGDPSWKWPSAGGLGFPVMWSVAGASECIVGSINQPGVDMQSAAVDLAAATPTLSPMVWRDLYFPAADQQSGGSGDWLSDPDLDGLVNLMEYALGGAPRRAESKALLPVTEFVVVDGNRHLAIDVRRNAAAVLQWKVQTSTDLQLWDTIDDASAVLVNHPTLLRVRNPGDGPRVFLRLCVEL